MTKRKIQSLNLGLKEVEMVQKNSPYNGCVVAVFKGIVYVSLFIFASIYLGHQFVSYRLQQMDLIEVNVSSGISSKGFIPDPIEKAIRIKFRIPRAYTEQVFDDNKLKRQLVLYATYPDFKVTDPDNREATVKPKKISTIRIGIATISSPFYYHYRLNEESFGGKTLVGNYDYGLDLYRFEGKDSYSEVNGKLVYDGMEYFLPQKGYYHIKEISSTAKIVGFPKNCVVETCGVGPLCIIYTFDYKYLKDWQKIDQKVRDFVQQFIIEYEEKGRKLKLNISDMEEEK